MSPFGLHHIAGNVWQWCRDWYDEDFYSQPEAGAANPVNQVAGKVRSERAGSWIGPAELCRSSYHRRSSANCIWPLRRIPLYQSRYFVPPELAMSKDTDKQASRTDRSAESYSDAIPACPVCGGELIDIRAKLQCARCHRICETCCEGGRG